MKNLISYIKDKYFKEYHGDIEYIVRSGLRGENGFIIIYFYSNGIPICVGKISRKDKSLIETEKRNILQMGTVLKTSKLRNTLENVIEMLDVYGYDILLKEFKEGINADVYIKDEKQEKIRSVVNSSCEWLTQFINDTKEYHIVSTDKKYEVAKGLIRNNLKNDWIETFIKDKKYFLSPSHGDLTLSNILIKNGKISAVVDYENFTHEGFPIADFIGIIVSIGTFLYEHTDHMINITFLENNWFSELIYIQISEFCNIFGLDYCEFVNIMPQYSDRALLLSEKWNMKNMFNYHVKLKSCFIEKKDDILKQLIYINKNKMC